jgi:hypothetical protein
MKLSARQSELVFGESDSMATIRLGPVSPILSASWLTWATSEPSGVTTKGRRCSSELSRGWSVCVSWFFVQVSIGRTQAVSVSVYTPPLSRSTRYLP